METHIFVLVLLLGLFMSHINFADSKDDDAKLSRRKRYVAFPEGSSLSAAVCLTVSMIFHRPDIYTQGLNWGIAYDLPNGTTALNDFENFGPKHVNRRRHRRDLYHRMELVMDSMGVDGRSCILRALCDTAHLFRGEQDNIFKKILKIIFKFPLQTILPYEPEDHKAYHEAHKDGMDKSEEHCAKNYPNCPISLIDLGLGYYTDYITPSTL
ncbi:PREDICTED: uncharacterized protein LOC108560241 [Nicrophorus vespilloides]|uniref:Uncharacterized protein LOC108560241 n=1 Tax=Nicrophorus vespilloides TaxID=110193 RepID=A0ABM1MF39_NICVS|nr:PREDICTED: uncharacterized protein LOC108560241 [Nicrophorus vespilloides]